MKTTNLFLLASVVALSAGCPTNNTMTGDDLTTTVRDMTTTTTMDLVTNPDMLPPPAPQLGDQIDRMGRPAINVAVTNPFDLPSTLEPMGDRNTTRDKYNKDSDPTTWVATWSPQLQVNLALYDGADTVCGNQVLACGALTGCTMAMAPAPGRYKPLGDLFADDRLYLDTSKTTCGTFYLAVEAGVNDCGGRTPTASEDAVDISYTALTVGAVPLTQGMTPINDHASDSSTVSLTAFPFLDAPK